MKTFWIDNNKKIQHEVHVTTFSIWLKSDLYLRYRIEDLITPKYWSCSSELCMNFVFAYCVMVSTNQIVYFKRSAVFLKMMKVV